jgi:voltage-gated potassium channel
LHLYGFKLPSPSLSSSADDPARPSAAGRRRQDRRPVPPSQAPARSRPGTQRERPILNVFPSHADSREPRPASVEAPTLSLGDALRPFARRLAWIALYFAVVLVIGTVGYMLIDGWPALDALYMAATTVTSVGFMEVRPLSATGRAFTMVLIALGVVGLGLWWAAATALIVELDLGGVLRRRRVMREIQKLKNHFIVCGVGRMGHVVVNEIRKAGHPFVVIERDPARVALIRDDDPEAPVIEGDATREAILRQAQVGRARGLAACLAEDADNLLVCLTARDLNRRLPIVARAYHEESVDRLRRAGADHVISPNQTGGVRMAFSLIRPNVVSFLDCVISDAGIELRLEEARIPPGSHLVGRTLAEAKIPQRTGLIVLGLRRAGDQGPPLYNPGPETRLEAGDVMIVLGGSDQVQQLREYVGVEVAP